MAARIVIQHLSGSKANQIEQFPLDGFTELTIGRDATSTVLFDAERDDAVSRRHAVIRIETGDQPSFKISDLGSRNGTRVNGEPIAAETELLPGDAIQLGVGGPRFTFDVQPPPANLMKRTRVIQTGAATGATRVLDTADIEAAALAAAAQGAAGGKRPVGRETVQGMLFAQRQQTNKIWTYVLAGVLALVGAGGGGLYYHNKLKTEQAQEENKKALNDTTTQVETKIGVSPEEIVRRYGNATVVIDTQWRLYDKPTGKPLFQMSRVFNKERLPCYVELPNGRLVRWLTTEDENHTNIDMGAAVRGSGFVISGDGFILTNKHVVAGWQVPYGEQELARNGSLLKGAVYKIGSNANPTFIDLRDSNNPKSRDLYAWRPDQNGGVVFRPDAPVPVDTQFHPFEGRSDLLQVRFPGNLLSVSAHLVRANSKADVAEIKIDTQQSLATVELASNDDVSVGEKVTVLGYPAFSAQTVAFVKSVEAGQFHEVREIVPEPTVNEGIVSQKSAGAVQQTSEVTTVGDKGETYQLTVPTGAGNSGGPVFNAAGKVIGLFTYIRPDRETVTYAVPIKFGRDLFQVQRTSN